MPMHKHRIMNSPWPDNVGILAIELYFPRQYVCQKDLENFDGVSEGKYTIGLGQSKMGFCSDREDAHSLCLTALNRLMEKTGVGYHQIGRLDVGTETLLDKSKSMKSVLMQLFEGSGNYDVEGVDSLNACYGGTAALLNAIHWIESSSWDGRLAAVVAGDIAVYAEGPARPTGGAGAVAMLVGPNAPLVFDRGLFSSHMSHTYDFYKPDFSSEYPTVDGKLSIQCYLSALDSCYQTYLRKASQKNVAATEEGSEPLLPGCLADFHALAFHSPYCKLVQKSLARLAFNDFLRCSASLVNDKYPGLTKFRDRRLEDTYLDREVEKSFMTFTKDMFEEKTKPSLHVATNVGNMYTPSLYGGLFSILASSTAESLAGKRIGLFSYGSGTASSMFSLWVNNEADSLERLRVMTQDAASVLSTRLEKRIKVDPIEFSKTLKEKERTHHKAPFTPTSDISCLFPGTWYLTEVDDQYRRHYCRVPPHTSEDAKKTPEVVCSRNITSSVNGITNGVQTNGKVAAV